MKLATFNLFQFVEPGYYWYEREPHCTYDPADWKSKTRWISQRLHAMDADVVGFQEVFSVVALEKLCAEAGYPYFAITDLPQSHEADPKVFHQSVVALASRYPLENPRTVTIHPDVKIELPLTDAFRFSRLPVCADITIPELGTTTVYVAHLKSKRPVTEGIRYAEHTIWPQRILDTMLRLSRGNVASMLQRGAEATLLYHSACQVLDEHPGRPLIILGDMNDDQDSTALRALTMKRKIYNIGGVNDEEWPDNVVRLLHDYRLADSFSIAPNMHQRVRPFTHVHRGQGNSLDHILVSNALNPRNPNAAAELVYYEVLNQHLEQDGVDNKLQSDHGQVVIELMPAMREHRAVNPAIHSQKDVLTRQDFVDLAGGVYQSRKHFRQWGSEDKWKNYWTFFFDNDHGWVTSIYGRTPVDELYQKKHHSIEHIIPQDFLSRYMTRQRAPRYVRYGASVNPFNFAPSERGLNAKRSNFPFDMDGDKVVRPQHLKIRPENVSAAGLDADNEWVIPSQNRGDIARSLLYMLLIYEIDELYNRHVDTLVHWAKIDSPSAWEVAYNNWVQQRLGIRNPFIDTTENALLLLNNKDLMRSIEIRGKH